MLPRIGRRERPVLPGGGEIVRGRADAASGNEKLPVRPEIASTAVGGQCEIVIKADSHACIARVLLDLSELPVDIPLQPAVEQNFAGVFGGKSADGVAGGITVWRGPVGPDPEDGVFGVEILVERPISGIETGR